MTAENAHTLTRVKVPHASRLVVRDGEYEIARAYHLVYRALVALENDHALACANVPFAHGCVRTRAQHKVLFDLNARHVVRVTLKNAF